MFPHGETVVRVRAGTTTDPYSNQPTPDWDTATSLAVNGCGVGDGGSLEPNQDARESVVSDFDVVMPSGTNIHPSDRLVVRGLTCEVVGRPFDWLNPYTGWRPGMVVRAKIVEG